MIVMPRGYTPGHGSSENQARAERTREDSSVYIYISIQFFFLLKI